MNKQAEFEALYSLHKDRLLGLAWKLTRSEDKAHDLVSEAFTKAWKGFKDFKSESSFGTWIYRILMNLVFDLGSPNRTAELTDNVPTEGRYAPDMMAEGRQVGARIDLALTKLSPQQRAVFLHRELDGMRHAEIANELGISESTSKVHYFHALKKLKEELHDLQ